VVYLQKVAIVTDSGTDLPSGFAAAHGIEVVPLTIHVDGKEYLDGVDIDKGEFYRILSQGVKELHTSQPSPASFSTAIERAAGNGESVLCICLSSKLSGTYQSAVLGAQMAETNVRVEIFDSLSASIGTGLMVVRAVELAEQGKELDEIIAELVRLRDAMRVLFLVDTLEYLEKNGRIGKTQALVGTLLKMKPVLSLEDGMVAAKEKVRGELRAMKRLVEIVVELIGTGKMAMGVGLAGGGEGATGFRGAIAHAAAPEKAQELRRKLAEHMVDLQELWVTDLSSTIGVHSGPGLVGVAFYPVSGK